MRNSTQSFFQWKIDFILIFWDSRFLGRCHNLLCNVVILSCKNNFFCPSGVRPPHHCLVMRLLFGHRLSEPFFRERIFTSNERTSNSKNRTFRMHLGFRPNLGKSRTKFWATFDHFLKKQHILRQHFRWLKLSWA